MADLPFVLITEHLDASAVEWLAARARLVLPPPVAPLGAAPGAPRDTSGISPEIADADGLIVRTYTTVDGALLDRARKLRVVGRAGAGIDNIDTAACRARGVEVVYTPDANTQAVVEYVTTLICDALRPRRPLDQAVERADWLRIRGEIVAPRQMSEQVLGVLGLGRIGRRVAEVGRAIGCTGLYHDILEIPEEQRHGAAPVRVEELFERSDVLTIHIDGRPSNREFAGAALVARMKSDVMFVNTSRGFVVDNVALAQFLAGNPDARALLDVHEPEPFGASYPLLGLSNATLFPHLAARTSSAMRNMSWVVRDVWAVLEDRAPRYPAPSAPTTG